MKLEKTLPGESSKQSEVRVAQERIDAWKKTYRQKKVRVQQSLEIEHTTEISNMMATVECDGIWMDFERTLRDDKLQENTL